MKSQHKIFKKFQSIRDLKIIQKTKLEFTRNFEKYKQKKFEKTRKLLKNQETKLQLTQNLKIKQKKNFVITQKKKREFYKKKYKYTI